MTMLLSEFTEENSVSPMGRFGVVRHPDICKHIEVCISRLDMSEDFSVYDIVSYLHEVYGGPDSGPMRWVTAAALENTLETYFCTSWTGRDKLEYSVGVEYLYDWTDYTTFYWRDV